MIRLLLFGALLALAGCGDGGTTVVPPLGPQAIDPVQYLVQSQQPNGSVATPLHASDVMTYRRQDFGGYQDEDAFLLPDGSAETAWSYSPFGPFVAANGDGGEHYTVAGGTVSIDATQDGGKPGVQTFNGWIAFRWDATATPVCFVAPIKAWTCYQRQTVDYPIRGAVDTIVSDHYNTSDATTAGAMERSFWGLGWGRLVWQMWSRGGAAADPDRCPDFGWNAPPQPGMILIDCREVVSMVSSDSPLTGAQEWHP